jgi:hypothetical protein
VNVGELDGSKHGRELNGIHVSSRYPTMSSTFQGFHLGSHGQTSWTPARLGSVCVGSVRIGTLSHIPDQPCVKES